MLKIHSVECNSVFWHLFLIAGIGKHVCISREHSKTGNDEDLSWLSLLVDLR